MRERPSNHFVDPEQKFRKARAIRRISPEAQVSFPTGRSPARLQAVPAGNTRAHNQVVLPAVPEQKYVESGEQGGKNIRPTAPSRTRRRSTKAGSIHILCLSPLKVCTGSLGRSVAKIDGCQELPSAVASSRKVAPPKQHPPAQSRDIAMPFQVLVVTPGSRAIGSASLFH